MNDPGLPTPRLRHRVPGRPRKDGSPAQSRRDPNYVPPTASKSPTYRLPPRLPTRKTHAAGRVPTELPEHPGAAEEIEKWQRLLDPEKTPIKEFIETYKVPTKRVAMLSTARAQVPFREWPNQSAIREAIEDQWKDGMGGKVTVGKPRQDGITTFCALLFWERFMRGGGGTWNIYSYDTDATRETFRLFKAFRRQTPAYVFEFLMHGGEGKWKRSSSMQFELDFPDGTSSLLQCLTAGDKSSGSGSSPRGILFDEFSKWKQEVKSDPTSMSEGWADNPGNLWLIPATGQGNEKFAQMFMDVYTGADQDSGFKALFFPWIGHPDRSDPIPSHAGDAKRFLESIGHAPQYGAKDEVALVNAGATPEEIKWRRKKLASPAFKGDLMLMRREYPLVASDLFESSALSVFHQQIDILKSHQRPALARDQGAKQVVFDFSDYSVVYDEAMFAPWLFFEEPGTLEDGHWYCWGADSASGKQTKEKRSKEADFAVVYVLHGPSGRTVARLRAHMDPEKLAEEIFKAAIYFGAAQGMPENNNYGQVTIARLSDMELSGVSGSELILSSKRWNRNIQEDEKGFFTTSQGKEILIADVREYLIEAGTFNPAEGTPFDSQFVEEALVYERDPKTGKAEAARGHDDCVVGLALAMRARSQLIKTGEVPLLTKARPMKALSAFDAYRIGAAAQERRRQQGAMSPILGVGF